MAQTQDKNGAASVAVWWPRAARLRFSILPVIAVYNHLVVQSANTRISKRCNTTSRVVTESLPWLEVYT